MESIPISLQRHPSLILGIDSKTALNTSHPAPKEASLEPRAAVVRAARRFPGRNTGSRTAGGRRRHRLGRPAAPEGL
ncbi:hypothetical protein ARTHRO9AX_220429 [Arthrobacter sp. 9AX]|nr:hypothetical protein ARTHRO9AX_220429 [Arthrobacter sp. 9AX]